MSDSSSLRPQILGRAFQVGTSATFDTRLELDAQTQQLYLIAQANEEQLFDCPLSEAKLEAVAGGGLRNVYFPGGHLFQTGDPAIVDWLGERGLNGRIRSIERFSPHLIAVAMLVIFGAFAVWRWGVPAMAAAAAWATPPAVLEQMDQGALYTLSFTTEDSRLSDEQKAQSQALFDRLVVNLPPDQDQGFNLKFLNMGIGPNAFALPGGTVILTDAIVEDFGDDPDLIAGVLGHEIGHVVEKHGLKQVYSSLSIYLFVAMIAGDTGPLLEELLLEGQLALSLTYSRDAELRADAFGLDLSSKAGFDPDGLARFFDQLQGEMGESDLPEWLSTHPVFEKRMEALRGKP